MKERKVRLTVNGQKYEKIVEARKTLADFIREDLDLTGTHLGCEHGVCGACTIVLGGEAVRSCLMFAAQVDGAEILTVEGLAENGALHRLQRAFIEKDAFQCGYCTPGQLCSAVGMLEEVRAGWPSAATQSGTDGIELSPAEIRERMSGNICRCAAYPNIVAAIAEASS